MMSTTRRPLVSQAIEALPPYVAGRSVEAVRAELGVADIVKLASNENPFGPSPLAVEAMARALTTTNRYPDDEALELRADLCRLLGVTPQQLVFGAGITDLLELSVRTFTTTHDHAIVSAGSFVAYKLFLLGSSVPFAEVPLAGSAIDLEAMARAVRPETHLIFLPNPNNPTGSRFTAKELDHFIAAIPDDVVLVLDDAYVEFHEGDDVPDTLAVLSRRPRTIVMRGFSKAYGLSGMRLGYAVSTEELCGHMRKVHRPFAVCRLAFEAGRAALADRKHVKRTVTLTREGRVYLARELAALGFRVLPSHANFVTLEFDDVAAAAGLTARMLRRGFIIRHVAAFGMPRCVRITVGTPEMNEAFVAAMRAGARES